MPIDVRPAAHDDVEALQRISREAWHAAHAPIVGEETAEAFLAEFYDADSFRDRIEDDERILAVAVDEMSADETTVDGTPVGFACAVAGENGTFDLGMCYVAPGRWGEGVGSRLLADVEDRIRARGGRRVELGVMAANERARAFYEAAGYREEGNFYDERVETRGCTYAKDLDATGQGPAGRG